MWFCRRKPADREPRILVRSVKLGSFYYVQPHGTTSSGNIMAHHGCRDWGMLFRLRSDGTGDYNFGEVTWEYVYDK